MDNDKDKKAKEEAEAKAKAEADEKARKEKEEAEKNNGESIPKHRFDEVNTELQKYKKAEEKRKKDEEEAEKKRLEDEGKLQELLEKERGEKTALQEKLAKTAKTSALKVEALKQGTVDADAVIALSNLDEVVVDADGNIDQASVEKVVTALKENKKYLFGEGQQNNTNIGNAGGAPAGGQSATPTFRRSQLRDSKFYAENKDAIMKAMREGKIIDDINPKKPQ